MTKKKPKFIRTDARKYSKLGIRRKKKQVYRKSKGIDNKIRLKMKGHVRNVSIGFRSEKKKRGLVGGLRPIMIHNLEDLKNLKQGELGIISKIGDKKRKQILEYALKHNIKLSINIKKALDKIEEKSEKAKEKKTKRQKKRLGKDKKAKKEAEKKEKQEKKAEEKTEKKTEEKKLIADKEQSNESKKEIAKPAESSSEKPISNINKAKLNEGEK